MNDMLERILCNATTRQQILTASKCQQCGTPSVASHAFNTNCHNGVYCNDCIQKCANKHNPLLNEKLIGLLKTVRFRCANAPNGCNELMNFDQIQEHVHSCIFKSPFAPSDNKFPLLNTNTTKPRSESRFFTPFTNTPPPCSPSINIEIASITSRNYNYKASP